MKELMDFNEMVVKYSLKRSFSKYKIYFII